MLNANHIEALIIGNIIHVVHRAFYICVLAMKKIGIMSVVINMVSILGRSPNLLYSSFISRNPNLPASQTNYLLHY